MLQGFDGCTKYARNMVHELMCRNATSISTNYCRKPVHLPQHMQVITVSTKAHESDIHRSVKVQRGKPENGSLRNERDRVDEKSEPISSPLRAPGSGCSCFSLFVSFFQNPVVTCAKDNVLITPCIKHITNLPPRPRSQEMIRHVNQVPYLRCRKQTLSLHVSSGRILSYGSQAYWDTEEWDGRGKRRRQQAGFAKAQLATIANVLERMQ